jgi:hypothetical protein
MTDSKQGGEMERKPCPRYAAAPGRECAACITPRVCKRDSLCFYPNSPDALLPPPKD